VCEEGEAMVGAVEERQGTGRQGRFGELRGKGGS